MKIYIMIPIMPQVLLDKLNLDLWTWSKNLKEDWLVRFMMDWINSLCHVQKVLQLKSKLTDI